MPPGGGGCGPLGPTPGLSHLKLQPLSSPGQGASVPPWAGVRAAQGGAKEPHWVESPALGTP